MKKEISNHKKNRLLLKIVSILVFPFLSTGTVHAQKILEEYLITAADNNPGLQARFTEYMAALEKIPQVGTLPDPTVAFGYFIQPVETRVGPQQARFSISQMFPWFGTLNASENAASEMAKSKYQDFEEAKSKLFFEVKSAWYNLYFTDRAISITRENLEFLNTFRQLALVKIEAGEASAVDEIRVEMEILDMENQLKLLLDQYHSAKIAFNNLINVNADKEIIIPDTLDVKEIQLTEKAIMDSIKYKNPVILSLGYQETSIEYQQKVAEKTGKPSFTIGMDYMLTGPSSNEMLSGSESGKDAFILPMAGIRIPLYRNKYSSMVKEAVLLKDKAGYQKDDKLNALETIFEETNTKYKDALRRIKLHKKQFELAGKALRILESEYAVNGENFEEILRMERNALMHNLELEKSITDFNTSKAFMYYLMGQ